jgi:hypothetical protein
VVRIEVMNLNRAPEFVPIANQVVSRDQTIDVPVRVNDPDGNPVKLRIESAQPGYPVPDFVSFTDHGDGTGTVRLRPLAGDRGDYGLTLFATDDGDGAGRWATIDTPFTFIVTVSAPNEPPRWGFIGDTAAVVGEPMLMTVKASDPDQEMLDYFLAGLPAGATITPGVTYGEAIISWTPTIDELPRDRP